jgi:Uma2 family endonuclease
LPATCLWPFAQRCAAASAAYDHGLKFEYYRNIDSLKEYLLVEQDRRHADLFRKGKDGLWVLYASGEADDVVLESVGVQLSMDLLFEDVTFPVAAYASALESSQSGPDRLQ